MDSFFLVVAIFILFGIPTLSATFAITFTSLSKRWFAFKQEELQLRRWETEARLEQARLTAGMPGWVDRTDPLEVAAWHKAVVEVYKLSARSAISTRPE